MLLSSPIRFSALASAALALVTFADAVAQNPPPAAPQAPAPSTMIVIPEEPRGIDQATLMPAKLAAPVKIEFKETSLTDVVKWLQTEQKLAVILDQGPLAKEGILVSEPVTDQLDNLPLHILLDRLRTIGVGWYLQEGLIHLTTREEAAAKMRTTPYNIGDLVDKKFKPERILEAVTATIAPDSWADNGGKASIVELGDVLFVSQSPENHLQVAGLLQALRKHGRRTYINDSPGHEKVRAALEKNVSLDLREVPFSAAIDQLGKQAGLEIRLDRSSFAGSKTRERQPVSLTLADQKLSAVLRVLLDKLDLTWVIRDSALWITSTAKDRAFFKTAVYDVRDLCQDAKEAEALKDAVENQMGGIWDSHGGAGTMEFPVPGAMVAYLTEQDHNRLLDLLESYRQALRVSKPRPRAGNNPKEVITRYYRMPSTMAEDLAIGLPRLIKEETWKSNANPNAPGTIMTLTSKAKLEAAATPEAKKGSEVMLVPYSVLVIKQLREVHDELPALLLKIEEGDAPIGGMGGMGGGGFGGGFFDVRSK